MNISIATDFMKGTGDPRPWLKMISEAGFTHLHWCHQWCTDFLYSDGEIARIAKLLRDYNLTLLDIHGSAGAEKCWASTDESSRKAGVELVANRIKMHAMLHGTGTIMMHIPYISSGTKQEDKPGIRAGMDALKKSIEELSPLVRGLGIPLAVENMPNDTFETIKELLAEFPPDIIGVCYDSGHGNMYESKGLDNLETCSDRLEALHLHDNDSTSDQHQPPFMGNIDWHRVMGIIAKSSYKREISFEMSIGNTPFKEDPKAFLADAYKRCSKAIQA